MPDTVVSALCMQITPLKAHKSHKLSIIIFLLFTFEDIET